MDLKTIQKSNSDITCLSISRNQGQAFKIGDNVIIEINKIVGKRTLVKIYAPKNLKILRSELLDNVDVFTG